LGTYHERCVLLSEVSGLVGIPLTLRISTYIEIPITTAFGLGEYLYCTATPVTVSTVEMN